MVSRDIFGFGQCKYCFKRVIYGLFYLQCLPRFEHPVSTYTLGILRCRIDINSTLLILRYIKIYMKENMHLNAVSSIVEIIMNILGRRREINL